MTIDLGIVEGFYGPLWTWPERERLIERLEPHGYRLYLYAPKADPWLRRRWEEPHPPGMEDEMTRFAASCRARGVRFGVGLSPYEVFNRFDDAARAALDRKLAFLERIGIHTLALLFDDMRGDNPDLAAKQVEIAHWIKARTGASQLMICPSYYSDDGVLDRVFGQRPGGYLEDLGSQLEPDIGIFWTGEEVCAREVSPGHLRRIARALGRKPMLWDNYPVNDGERMSRHLHLRGFSGRPAANTGYLAGHMINPALQPTLTAIPAITLAESYRLGPDYEYGVAFERAATEVLGEELARQVVAHLLLLQDTGLLRLSPERKAELSIRYSAFDHPGAREIIRWLEGEYQVTDEMVQTQ